jgi:hypothetical protein
MIFLTMSTRNSRENPYDLLTDWVHETDHFNQIDIRHEVRRQLDLVSTVGSRTKNEQLSLKVPSAALEKMDQCLE